MQIWHQFPFVRIVAPFIAGTIAALIFQTEFAALPVILGAGILLYLILALIVFKKLTFKYRYINGAIIHILLFGLAYQLTIERTEIRHSDHLSKFLPCEKIVVTIIEPVTEKDKTFKVVAKALALEKDKQIFSVSGKLILYFEKGALVRELGYGDVLAIDVNPDEVLPPGNPGQFNYKRYLANKGIYHQAFVRLGSWNKLNVTRGSWLKSVGISLRQKFLDILKKNDLAGKEYAVASAILLGYDEYLDSEQKKQFAGAGAMHILCVSGLHVGIIYVILNSLLKVLNRRKFLRIIKVLLLLIMIWFYALITGLSPSVMRASTMFSFIIVGQSLQRKTNIYNSLAASAFLLIVIDPYILTAVGFQLSYLAVLGIVTLFKPIYNLFVTSNWLLNQIWSITVVSISATIATFPLSIFYFHQFPNLFLITNLVAIPASMFILYLGILVLIASPIHFISQLFARVLVWIIKGLNISVGWIESIPIATSSNIYINLSEALIIFTLILTMVSFLMVKRKYLLILSLLSVLYLISSFTLRKYQRHNQQNVIVYNIRNHSAIGFLNGTREVILADSLLLSNNRKIDFSVKPHLIEAGISDLTLTYLNEASIIDYDLIKNGIFIYTPQFRILLLDETSAIYPIRQKKKINIDFAILSNNSKVDIIELCDQFNVKQFIFDSSNKSWRKDNWKAACESAGIPFYDVASSGAWLAVK